MILGMKAREPERYARIVARFPKGRMGDPLEDLGRPLVALVADAARHSGKMIRMKSDGVDVITQHVTEAPLDAN